MARRDGQIVISLPLLRLILGLPQWMEIDGIVQTDDDWRNDECRLLVRGPFCPSRDEGADRPILMPVYERVDVGKATLREIQGVDT